MDTAAIVLRKPDARIVWPALEDESAPIRSDIRLVGDELLLRHPEETGYAQYLLFGNAN